MNQETQPLLRHAGTSRSQVRGQRLYGSSIEGNEDPEFDEVLTFPEPINMKKYIKECFTVETVTGKLPIIKWLPKYS